MRISSSPNGERLASWFLTTAAFAVTLTEKARHSAPKGFGTAARSPANNPNRNSDSGSDFYVKTQNTRTQNTRATKTDDNDDRQKKRKEQNQEEGNERWDAHKDHEMKQKKKERDGRWKKEKPVLGCWLLTETWRGTSGLEPLIFFPSPFAFCAPWPLLMAFFFRFDPLPRIRWSPFECQNVEWDRILVGFYYYYFAFGFSVTAIDSLESIGCVVRYFVSTLARTGRSNCISLSDCDFLADSPVSRSIGSESTGMEAPTTDQNHRHWLRPSKTP